MKFAPKPENDFAEFIRTYYRACRHRFAKIEAIAGKWMFRDLIPGMSDFDTRLILHDDMTIDDWCALSTIVGETHLELCHRYPCWARNFEHLPGVNLTWHELTSERTYYPEYQQWTYYDTEEPARVSAALRTLAERPWDIKDEYFHLKRFVTYYGRYDRSIDPPINLGVHENKYPLHSRIMHYFNPPVLAAVCLLNRRNLAGKMDAFETASRMFPHLRCWDVVREILHANYELPQWYREPQLTQLEDLLETALAAIAPNVLDAVRIVPGDAGTDMRRWKTALRNAPLDPALVIFDNAKFSRLMKGRLYFYTHAPPHFDTTWLIQNELRRLGNNFFRVPFATFWKIKTGEVMHDPAPILDQLRGDPLTKAELEATKAFGRLTPGHWEAGQEQQIAQAIIGVFDGFFSALTKISESV